MCAAGALSIDGREQLLVWARRMRAGVSSGEENGRRMACVLTSVCSAAQGRNRVDHISHIENEIPLE